jgi:hypothetical protein
MRKHTHTNFNNTDPGLIEEHALLSDRLIFRDNLGLLKNIAGFAALGASGNPEGMGTAIQKQVRCF